MENVTTNTEDRELVSTRLLDAPRELVYKVWTTPEHIVQWWGPNGFTNTIKEMDVTPGGTWRFTMHSADGTDFLNKVVYEEVIENEKLVYVHSGEGEHDDAAFHVTVTFEEEGDKTKLTMRMVFATAEQRNEVVEKYGALEGQTQTMNKLEVYLKRL